MEYLVKATLRYKYNTLSEYKICEFIGEHFVLGYEVIKDGEVVGVSFSCVVDGKYTLDGYNYGVSIFSASHAGKLVLKDLKIYTDIVFTIHKEVERSATVLAKRIGFKEIGKFDGNIIFSKEI